MTPEELAAIRKRAADAKRNREIFGKESRSRRIVNEASALDAAALLAEVERLTARLDKVRALHKPEARWSAANQPEWSSEYESEALEAADGGDVRRFEVCTHCANVDDMRAYSPELDYKDSIYPCPTIQTLDGSDQ